MRYSTMAAVAILLGRSAAAAGQQPPVIGSAVEMVSVDVSVIRDGRAVDGLKAADFEVRDEGERRQVELVSAGEQPLSVLLVVDISRSMEDEGRLRRLRAAALSLLPELRPSDRAGIMAFDEDVRLLATMGSSPIAMRAILSRLAAGGSTSLRDALWSALKLGEGVRGRMLIIAFSDGLDESSWVTEQAVLDMARESNAVLHVLYTGPKPLAFDQLLRGAAGLTGGRVWEAGEDEDLELALRRALAEMRSRYVLRFEKTAGARPGWRRLEVKLKGVRADLLARRGYYLPPAP